MPLVGITNSGRCRRASRSARSWAKAAPLASSSLCTAVLAVDATATICMPSTEPVTTPPSMRTSPAASTVSAGCGFGRVAHRVRGSGGRAGCHRRDHQAALQRNRLGLAVQAAARAHVDDVGGGDSVTDVGVAIAVGVRRMALIARVGPELRGHRQAQRDQIVGVVQVVELGRADDLRLTVEGGVVTKLQVTEVAELVERDDVGDFVRLDATGVGRSSNLPQEIGTNGAVPT